MGALTINVDDIFFLWLPSYSAAQIVRIVRPMLLLLWCIQCLAWHILRPANSAKIKPLVFLFIRVEWNTSASFVHSLLAREFSSNLNEMNEAWTDSVENWYVKTSWPCMLKITFKDSRAWSFSHWIFSQKCNVFWKKEVSRSILDPISSNHANFHESERRIVGMDELYWLKKRQANDKSEVVDRWCVTPIRIRNSQASGDEMCVDRQRAEEVYWQPAHVNVSCVCVWVCVCSGVFLYVNWSARVCLRAYHFTLEQWTLNSVPKVELP